MTGHRSTRQPHAEIQTHPPLSAKAGRLAIGAKDRQRTIGIAVNRCARDAKSDRWQVQTCERRPLQCMSLLSSLKSSPFNLTQTMFGLVDP